MNSGCIVGSCGIGFCGSYDGGFGYGDGRGNGCSLNYGNVVGNGVGYGDGYNVNNGCGVGLADGAYGDSEICGIDLENIYKQRESGSE